MFPSARNSLGELAVSDDEQSSGDGLITDAEGRIAAFDQLTFAIAAHAAADPATALEMIGGVSLDFRSKD